MIKMTFKKHLFIGTLLGITILTLGACSSQSQSVSKSHTNFEELSESGKIDLTYATMFSAKKYGDYTLINIADEDNYLLVPEGMEVPYNLPEDTLVLQQPLDETYLVSTSVMDLLRQLGVLDRVQFSGTQEKDWYVEEAAEAMKEGSILYAGRYSAPDYELLLSQNCDLAIENTMIYHNPDVKEKLEELNIPVLVEYSSYEGHPLGRLEWIKLYGCLFGKEEEAKQYFDAQCEALLPIMEQEKTGKSIAFFYVTSNGAVNVRKPNDYIAQMIELAGGSYALNSVLVEEENALSTMNMQMEDFYAAARDADILIYNSTIDGELENIDELLEKSMLFADFKAVKENRVYCTSKNFFQESTGIAEFMEDLHLAMTEETQTFTYLNKLERK